MEKKNIRKAFPFILQFCIMIFVAIIHTSCGIDLEENIGEYDVEVIKYQEENKTEQKGKVRVIPEDKKLKIELEYDTIQLEFMADDFNDIYYGTGFALYSQNPYFMAEPYIEFEDKTLHGCFSNDSIYFAYKIKKRGLNSFLIQGAKK